jgi:uncharacterized membrane protein YebE (DUF533 family)
MSALKIVAGSVAVASVAVIGYKALQRYKRKKAEKQIHKAFDDLAAELEKHFGEGPMFDFSFGER